MTFALPAIVVFIILAVIADRRGWYWVSFISVLCIGAFAAQTSVGATVIHGFVTLVDNGVAAVISMLNTVAR